MTDLLVSFAAAGGAPPASQELVRVFRDGRVRALAGTAWPGLGRVDEAGAYAFELDAGALAELERLAEAAAGEELDGPREPGSGRFALDVGDGARLRWDPFTTPPEPVAALADRLRALLVEAREHPLAAVRLELEASGADPLRLTYRFTARGSEPISLTVASLRARVVEAPLRAFGAAAARLGARGGAARHRPCRAGRARAGRDVDARGRDERAGRSPARRRLRPRRARPRRGGRGRARGDAGRGA